jgi:malate permease and related proteins
MQALSLFFTCLALGVLVARAFAPPAGLAQSLNWWVINVALPALVLAIVPSLPLSIDLWFPVAAMWFVFLGGWALFAAVGRWACWSRARVGALTLTCGLGNSAFIGLPLIEALRGREALQVAAVADQGGVFLALAIGGSLVAALYSGDATSTRAVVRKVLLFPPFLALLAALLAGAAGGWPPGFAAILARLCDTLVPLALFSVGLQLRLGVATGQLGAIGLGLGWKLALAPLCVYAFGRAAGLGGDTLEVSVLQAAMAPMISGAILAEQHRLEPALANKLLGAGILLSFLSVPVVDQLLRSA